MASITNIFLFGLVVLLTDTGCNSCVYALGSDLILQSPIVTNWGNWGEWSFCPNGTYVVAMELQSDRVTQQSSSGSKDQVGLTGVRLYCSEPGTYNGTDVLASAATTDGAWGSKFYCGHAAIGFQLRSEPNQGGDDDSAANNMRLICSSSSEGGSGAIIEGDGTAHGDWTTLQRCFPRQALCGLQTMVEPSLGSTGDDTGLNNIRVACCDVPPPTMTCTPTDEWDLLVECDNRDGLTAMTCGYEKRIGVSRVTTQSEGGSDQATFYDSLEFSTGFAAQGLSLNFKYNLGQSTTTGYKWDQSSSNEWHEETTTTVTFDVDPGLRAELYQTLGRCGFYTVRPVRFRRVDAKRAVEVEGDGAKNSTTTTKTTTGQLQKGL